MVLLRTRGVQPGTDRPELTPVRQLGRANAQRWKGQGIQPGLDPRLLSARYGGDAAYRPRLRKATFRVPLGVQADTFERESARLVHRWIVRMDKDGWDWCKEYGIQIAPGHYPAYDTDDQGSIVADLGSREFVAQAVFKQRAPVLVRTEIAPALLQAVDVRWTGSQRKKGVS